MTYASINEAWGGVSGSNQLATPMNHKIHPMVDKQRNDGARVHTAKDLYKCTYGSHDCEQIFKQNQQINEQNKHVAAGVQPFLPGSVGPLNYTFSPQYPWYPWAQYSYMMYGPQLSKMWYEHPYQTNPYLAQQIAAFQQSHPGQYSVPIGPYYPQGFVPLEPRYDINPPLEKRPKKDRREDFGEYGNNNAMKSGIVYFIFFLFALAVVMCLFMICVMCKGNNVNLLG